jgi:hypothetical protein
MASRIALATVVTASHLREFFVLRHSFEQFHPVQYQWFVRCDRASENQIGALPRTVAIPFCDLWEKPVTPQSRPLLREKMNAIADAWAGGESDSVAFLASDLIFTGSCLEAFTAYKSDLVLTPNFFPWRLHELSPYYGYFNSGFALTRSRRFHERWRQAFLTAPWKYSDQACLNDVAPEFSVTLLGQEANIGAWRSDRADSFVFKPIPKDCLFLRTSCFSPLVTQEDWIGRMFALHCLRFLKASDDSARQRIHDEILQNDESGWYQASLRLFN